jgi:hypothetical protein
MKNQAALLTALAWAVFAGAALWLTRHGVALDTDSAMRLAGVRDLLHGQSWFDTSQHRLNTPYGLPMHWSRLVDAPLALLMLAGEGVALRAWPLLLFFGVLFVLARLAAAVSARAVPVVLGLALLCVEIFGTFSPGDIDHHGLQLLLMLAALLGVVEKRPVLAAVAVALGLGVGLEVLPYAVVAILIASLWLRDEPVKARVFGATLGTMAIGLRVLTTAWLYRDAPVCDTYSYFYSSLLFIGGGGLTIISVLPRYRLVALASLVVLLLGLAALDNPACFAGPYAGMDPRMKTIFLARINEARSVWSFWQLAPSQVVGGFCYGAFALAMTWFAPRGRARTLVLVFGAMALVVASLQYRATPFLILFALPGLAAALTRLLDRRSIVWLVVAVLVCNSAVFTLMGALLEGQDQVALRAMHFQAQEACGEEKAMGPLNALPPGRVAGFVDQGPAILAYTGDSAIAGPYHRDAAGILDTYDLFTGPNPRAILAKRGIDYLMTCRAAPDWDFYAARGGLMAQLAAGQVPDWLTPAGTQGDVAVYRVRR